MAETQLNAIPSADPVNHALERCLGDLRQATDALRIVRGVFVPTVRRETLPPSVPYVLRGPDDFRFTEPAWLTLHDRQAESPALPPLTDHERFHWYFVMDELKAGFPVAAQNLHLVNARGALDVYGEPIDCIVRCALAAETLLDGVLLMMMWEEGARSSDVKTAFEDVSIAKRIKTEYHIRLSGSWNQDQAGPVGDWRRSVADPRNRVVHSGQEPSREEAREAVNAAAALHRFIADRLLEKADRYPKSALMLNGIERLREGDAASNTIVDLYDREGRGESNVLEEFRAWRESVLTN